ncbi:hypothetical protein Pmani_029662 [Petrolisthes manimaculis]|uniref:Uncharacterized protein n=1 Tax=Petrolisthes manimaculis TaxID=1843537 RepID=A0AAE1TUF4_9EUCA|nr:hypothetical protein Pmani_029662 [Petrolisthes manimaculis]
MRYSVRQRKQEIHISQAGTITAASCLASTLNHLASTLNHLASTLNHLASTLNHLASHYSLLLKGKHETSAEDGNAQSLQENSARLLNSLTSSSFNCDHLVNF